VDKDARLGFIEEYLGLFEQPHAMFMAELVYELRTAVH
jgi:hypothetical protein